MPSTIDRSSSSDGELTAHKLASIVPMIEAVGASVIYLYLYSGIF
jgi:hypothetical protein